MYESSPSFLLSLSHLSLSQFTPAHRRESGRRRQASHARAECSSAAGLPPSRRPPWKARASRTGIHAAQTARRAPQLNEAVKAFEKLNGEEMDEAIQKTTFKNILPLIQWFEKAAVMSDAAYDHFMAVRDALDLKINADRLEAKLVEKGFPTYEQWNEIPCYTGEKKPVRDEKYADLSRIERFGICIALDIQFVSRPGTYISHFWDRIEDYKEELKVQQIAPRVIQKSHANNLHRKPDSSRGDRTDSKYPF